MRKIIHIDMDCFYAAIETRDNPKLKNKPVAVGGAASSRGVLCTCNYQARKYGIHSAMPTAQALKLCPDLQLLPVDMNKYRAVSKSIRDIFYNYTNLVEPLSLDEAYLDVTHCSKQQGSATWIAQEIQKKIFESEKLTASAGIAPNKFLAKVASDWHKPNGILTITPQQIEEFVGKLPVTKIFGVGKVMGKKLHNLNILTCADLQRFSLHDLIEKFGKFGAQLYQLARGVDNREVNPNRIRKSISVEYTYAQDLKALADCINEIPELLERLRARLLSNKRASIQKQFIKIKFNDFTHTTAECIHSQLNQEIFIKLLTEGYRRHNKPVRLLGIGVRFSEVENVNLEMFE